MEIKGTYKLKVEGFWVRFIGSRVESWRTKRGAFGKELMPFGERFMWKTHEKVVISKQLG
jgi:hypothetical protein